MAEGTAEEGAEGVKNVGLLSLSAGSLTRVEVVGEEIEEVGEGIGRSSDRAYRLQGCVTRTIKMREERNCREERRLVFSEWCLPSM